MTDLAKRLPLPAALGAALWALTKEPGRLEGIISQANISALVKPVKYAFVASATLQAIDYINTSLNAFAYNNFRLADAKVWDWPKEIVLITGGASGIGAGLARALVQKDLQVVIVDVSEPSADLASSPRIYHYKCSVTDPAALAATAEQIRKEVGHPSILVNNAGLARSATILKSSAADVSAVIGVNLMAHWNTVQEFLPHMLETRKGHIVTIASVAAFISPET